MEDKPQETEVPLDSKSAADYANISHQKGDIDLITWSKDRIELLLSATGSLASNFMFLMLGNAMAVFLALKSGAVEQSWRRTFWLGFFGSLVMSAFFAVLTTKQELQKRRFRKDLRKKTDNTD